MLFIFRCTECVLTGSILCFQFISKFVECNFSIISCSCANDQCHVVEQVETIQWRWFTLCVCCYFVPPEYRTLYLFLNCDGCSVLICNVLFVMTGYRHCMVERNIDDDTWNVQFLCKVFIPFQQCITDVVTCDNQVWKRNISCFGVCQFFRFLTC